VSKTYDELNKLQQIILTFTLHPYNKTQSQIQKQVNCSRSTVWKVWKQLVELGLLKRDEKGKIIRDLQQKPITKLFSDITQTEFGGDPNILTFIESLKRSKVDDWRRHVTRLWIVCETLRIRSDSLLAPILQTQQVVDMFEKEFRAGKAKYTNPNALYNFRNKEKTSINHYIKSIKSFRDRLGIETAKGYLETKEEKFDAYKRVKLNDVERSSAIAFMATFGKIWKNIFILHHELGVRSNTLFSLRPIFERRNMTVDGHDCEYYVCYPHEEKQNHDYEKPILTPEAKEVVKNLENGKPLQTILNTKKAKAYYNSLLRKLFIHLGKIQLDQDNKIKRYEQGTQEYYYNLDPTHAIRHSSIHKLMRITGFKSDVVSSFFWDVPDTLSIYQRTSLDEIMQQGSCLICNKPKEPDPRFEIFCNLRHACLYYNQTQDLNKIEQTSFIVPVREVAVGG